MSTKTRLNTAVTTAATGTVSAPAKTLVIGAGAWGTALAVAASQRGEVLLYARHDEQAAHINAHHRNPRYLSDLDLPHNLRATAQQAEALAFLATANNAKPHGSEEYQGSAAHHGTLGPHTQGQHNAHQKLSSDHEATALPFIIFAVPVKAMRPAATDWLKALAAEGLDHLPYVWTCKGFEQGTGLLPHEVMAEIRPEQNQPNGVLSGPTFAREVAQGLPVAITVASQHQLVQRQAIHALHAKQTRVYVSQDVIGVEVGGALKNVIALACGISDGLALGNNARAALITRGLHEIRQLGMAMGGHADTFSGLTGLGDLVLTATGDLSRNRQVGLALAQGQRLEDILATGLTAEGVPCTQAALSRAQRLGVDMPITQAVCDVLFDNADPLESVARLLARDVKAED